MQVQIKKASPAHLRSRLFCMPLFEGEGLKKGLLTELDRACGGVISAALKSGDFSGKLWSSVTLYNPKPSGPRRVLLLGVGKEKDLDLERIRQAASRTVSTASKLKATDVGILIPSTSEYDHENIARALTEGCLLGSYKFDKYRADSDNGTEIKSVHLVTFKTVDRKSAQTGVDEGTILAEAVCKARDMVNAPANELTPTEMARRAQESAKAYGYKATIFDKKEIVKRGMTGLEAVSRGSDQPPKFIILEYNGGGPRAPRYAFVGKGLTFDAGGICIKPAPKMDEMKGDMGGGAAVLGAMEAVARLKLPAHVVGLVPSTENLLGGSAYRPGDILRMMNGKTVMVDNTDAEGRLILADALVYAQRYKPQAIIDLATLTGAALIALGQVATAVLGNDRQLIEDLKVAGQNSFERVWELPLWPEFEELLRSPIADMKNTGGKYGGTITAAAFLKNFVGDTPWAHLDIAGTSYLDKADGYRPQAGTGVGVRLLVEYLRGQLAQEK